MALIIAALVVLTGLFAFALGLFLFIRPAVAIETQRKFYVLINWRMEPISMPQEIRNTRVMGIGVIVLAALVMVYAVCFP